MKFKAEFDIDDIVFNTLMDHHKGYTIDSEYIITHGLETLEWDMGEYFDSGFYEHYPLQPTPLGHLIINSYLNKL